MQAATASNPRRQHPPRRVIYKSSALERTAPHLVAAAPADRVSAAQSIQNANAAAENVRLAFKQGRGTPLASSVDGHDDVSNAKKYERRLKMNRQSAAASRVRREAYTKALEAELVKMESEYKAAVVNLQAALERNRQLEKTQDDDGQPVDQNGQLKQEDEECDPDDVVEPADHALDAHHAHEVQHDLTQDHVVEQVAEEDPEVWQAFADLEQTDIDQFFTQAAQPKFEQLLSDPALSDNKHLLNLPIPDTLPDCFLHPPVDHDFAGNEFL